MLNDLSPIHIVIFLSLSGIILRSSLSLVGQNWVRTYHFLGTFILLPNIAYIITTVIAGDIALSLGMIGALSIVRFRHPVKSALELIIYFDLITLGIATSVRTKWAIQLVLCTILILIIVKIINILIFLTCTCNLGGLLGAAWCAHRSEHHKAMHTILQHTCMHKNAA